MKKIIVVTLFILFYLPAAAQHEVIYHVFQRSFFDSNGDSHRDSNKNWITSRSSG